MEFQLRLELVVICDLYPWILNKRKVFTISTTRENFRHKLLSIHAFLKKIQRIWSKSALRLKYEDKKDYSLPDGNIVIWTK